MLTTASATQRPFSAIPKRCSRVPPAIFAAADRQTQPQPSNQLPAFLLGVAASAAVLLAPGTSLAVSGGGGDGTSFAFADLSGRDLSNKRYVKADMRGAVLDGANLTGTNLFGANLLDSSLKGASMRAADLEGANLEGADLTGAVLEGAQVTGTRWGRKPRIANTDWTDVVLRKDIQMTLCQFAEGVNPETGVDTRESLLCPE